MSSERTISLTNPNKGIVEDRKQTEIFSTLGLFFYDPNYLLSYLVVAILIFLAIKSEYF